MAAIWLQTSDGRWAPQAPTPFANEAALHDMVMGAPELLPLSGDARLTVLGREVAVGGSGYADILAIEADGRPVIIEVKLRNNAESRRAVVAQALSYAAAIHGLSREDFEGTVLSRHLNGRSLFDVVREDVQEESLSQPAFEAAVEDHLAGGSFRVVVVLDEAPAELVKLMGYLESVTTGLTLDLIAVSSYEIGKNRIAVPQRLDPEHPLELPPSRSQRAKAATGTLVAGTASFRERIEVADDRQKTMLRVLVDWAESIADDAALVLETYFDPRGEVILLPRYRDTKTGLVSIWHYVNGPPALSLWRSVFEKRAPEYIDRVEAIIGKPISVGNQTRDISPELLEMLKQAYIAGSA